MLDSVEMFKDLENSGDPADPSDLAGQTALNVLAEIPDHQQSGEIQRNGTMRTASVTRGTKESQIYVDLDIDGGRVEISTGIGFFDHMLTAFAVHGNFGLKIIARGDYHVEAHHTVEDTAIVLGQAFAQALADKRGIQRFGNCFIPMDEALVHAVVDISNRPYPVFTGEPEHMLTSIIHGDIAYATVLNQHFFETFATNSLITLHVRVLSGRDPHHITEAEYKAVARALREAVSKNTNNCDQIPSTKGTL